MLRVGIEVIPGPIQFLDFDCKQFKTLLHECTKHSIQTMGFKRTAQKHRQNTLFDIQKHRSSVKKTLSSGGLIVVRMFPSVMTNSINFV